MERASTRLMRRTNGPPISQLYNMLNGRLLITAKATILSNNSQVIFSVPMAASKSIVKQAVEKLFGVNVKKINMLVSKGKTKRFKGKMGKRKNEKKAIISLEKGQKIDITTGI